MSTGPQIVPGSQVTLHLSLTLADGTEALSTFGDEPLTLVVGDGTLQPGLELALYGLRAGDTDSVTLAPEQGYGWPDDAQVHDVPLADFPEPGDVEVGQVIGFSLPSGDEVAGTVVAVSDAIARVDFNHPLAGHELILEAQILAVAPPQANDDERG
jgi:FKBP-type peptidyl-prolyl cis-trans isomerase SlpA